MSLRSSNTSEGSKYLTVYSSYCTVKNLEQFTAYSFRVSALRDIDSSIFSSKYISSDYSEEVKVQTKLSAVKDFKFVDATENSIKVSWTINDKATEYELKMGSSASSVNTPVNDKPVTTGKTCTVTVTRLSASNDVVYFTVAAKNGSNVGIISNTTGKTAPNSVSGLEVESTTVNSAKFKITCASGADGYEVSYKDGATEKTALLSNNTLNGLTAGTEYTVRIRAYNEINGKKLYSGYSSPIKVSTKLATPTGIKAEIKDGKVVVSWNAVTGATAYNVYRDGDKVGNGVTANSFQDSNTNPGQTYSYKVEAVKSSFTSEKSNAASVTTGIADVTGVNAEVKSPTEITVSWTKVDGAKYYMVSCNDNKPVKVEGLTYNALGLTGSTEYTFKVQAFVNSEIHSGVVSSKTVKTMLAPVDISKIQVIKRTADSVILSWSRNVSDERYSITVNAAQGSKPNVSISVSNPVRVEITGITADATTINIVIKLGTETSASVSYDIHAFVSAAAA